jgi:hypothetical protein
MFHVGVGGRGWGWGWGCLRMQASNKVRDLTFENNRNRNPTARRDVKQCIAFATWISHFMAAMRPKLAQCGAYDASRLLDCLAELGHRPDREFMAAWCGCMQVCGSLSH